MSVRISTWVWHHSGAAGNDLLILLALADQADDAGLCWPSAQYIADKTRLSRRTVQRRLAELAAESKIITVKSGKKWGGSNHYRFLVDEPTPVKPEVRQDDAGVRQIVVRQNDVRQTDVRQSSVVGGATPSDARGTTTSGARNVIEPSVNREAAKKPAAATRKTKMPDGWWPSDDLGRWARDELGPDADLKALTQHFIDHHAANGNRFVSWDLAWKNWVRNDKRFNKRPTGRQPQGEAPEDRRVREAKERRMAREAS